MELISSSRVVLKPQENLSTGKEEQENRNYRTLKVLSRQPKINKEVAVQECTVRSARCIEQTMNTEESLGDTHNFKSGPKSTKEDIEGAEYTIKKIVDK